jgi:hypothetical protein
MQTHLTKHDIGKWVKWWSNPFQGHGILRDVNDDNPETPYKVEDMRKGKPCGNWLCERVELLEDVALIIKPAGTRSRAETVATVEQIERKTQQGVTRDTWEQQLPMWITDKDYGRDAQGIRFLMSMFTKELLKSIDAERGNNDGAD